MAPALPASRDDRIAANKAYGHQLGIEQGHKPPHWPREATLPLPPAHEAASLQGLNPKGNLGCQHIGGGLPWFEAAGKQKWPLSRVTNFQGLGGNATAFRKAKGCSSWLAILEGLGLGRPLALLLKIWLAMRQPRDADHQPAGRTCAVNALVTEPQGGQIAAHQLLQLGQG